MARNLPTIDKPKLAPAPTICRLRNEAVSMINNYRLNLWRFSRRLQARLKSGKSALPSPLRVGQVQPDVQFPQLLRRDR